MATKPLPEFVKRMRLEKYQRTMRERDAKMALASKEPVTVTQTGAKSSPSLPFDQIPYRALVKMAERFQKGIDKGYDRDNWRKGLGDLEYVLERLSHGGNHLARLIEKINDDKRGVTNPDDPKWKGEYWDDDVAAVLWACCLVVETVWQKEWEEKRKVRQNEQ